MEIYENLEVVDVLDDDEMVKFILLDNDRREIHDVKWRKKAYDSSTQSYVADDNKLKQVEEWSKQYFGLPLKDIGKAVGKTATVYGYETFDSFWQSDAKFEKKDKGKIFQTKVKDVQVSKENIKIQYEWNGKTYSSYKRFTETFGDKYYINPQKRKKQIEWFEDMFGESIENCRNAVGKDIIVEVKGAFGNKVIYGDIKPGIGMGSN